jgi:hypothetical protein
MESKRIWRKLAVTKTEQESVGDRIGYDVYRLVTESAIVSIG